MRKIVFTFFTILCMAAIFFFSSRTAVESTEDSNQLGMIVGKIMYRDFAKWTEEEQIEYAQKIDDPIRKLAHATEYAVLSFFISGAVYPVDIKENKRRFKYFFVAIALAVAYAISDEIHQYFVPGRACQVKDICIDAVGAMVGATIWWTGHRIIKNCIFEGHNRCLWWGEDYGKFRRCIGISLLDFNLTQDEKGHKIYRMWDAEGNDFADLMELHCVSHFVYH